jgi:hypothetical protein
MTTFRLPTIHHLIRYFFAAGVIVFFVYWKKIQIQIALVFIGPCLYLASMIKKFLVPAIPALSTAADIQYLTILLPITLTYYLVASFLFKELWNERGIIRILSLLGLVGFLIYIHLLAWENLKGYTL